MDQNQNPQSIILIWKAMDCGFGCSFVWLFCNLMNGKVVGTSIVIDKTFFELKILLESAIRISVNNPRIRFFGRRKDPNTPKNLADCHPFKNTSNRGYMMHTRLIIVCVYIMIIMYYYSNLKIYADFLTVSI